MEALRQYAFSVIGGAMVCGVILGMVPKGATQELLKLLCGIFLSVSILSPIAGIRFDFFPDDLLTDPRQEAQEAVSMGETYSRNLLAQCIKETSEEYILDKAAAMDAAVKASVTVSEDPIPVPVAVILWGQISPAAKERLGRIICDGLGISKENQQWTDGNSQIRP